MLKLLKSAQPPVLILIPIFAGSYSVNIGMNGTSGMLDGHRGYLFDLLFSKVVVSIHPILSALLISGLLTAATFMYISLIFKTNILDNKNFLIGFILLSIAGFIQFRPHHIPFLVGTILLIRALQKSLVALRAKVDVATFFDVGLFVSLASLFYFNFIWIALLFVLSKIFIRREHPAELLSIIVGVISPYILLVMTEFVLTGNITVFESVKNNATFQTTDKQSLTTYVALGYVSGLTFVSGFMMLGKYFKLNILTRDYIRLFILELFVVTVMTLVLESSGSELFLIPALSIAIPISYFFNSKYYNGLKSLVFFLMLILIVLIQTQIDLNNNILINKIDNLFIY